MFTEFIYQNQFFIQSNDNINKQTPEIDWIRQEEKKFIQICTYYKYFFYFFKKINLKKR